MALVETDLEMAERHVRVGREHITKQLALIEDLKGRGAAIDQAERLLANFEDLQQLNQAHLLELQAAL